MEERCANELSIEHCAYAHCEVHGAGAFSKTIEVVATTSFSRKWQYKCCPDRAHHLLHLVTNSLKNSNYTIILLLIIVVIIVFVTIHLSSTDGSTLWKKGGLFNRSGTRDDPVEMHAPAKKSRSDQQCGEYGSTIDSAKSKAPTKSYDHVHGI